MIKISSFILFSMTVAAMSGAMAHEPAMPHEQSQATESSSTSERVQPDSLDLTSWDESLSLAEFLKRQQLDVQQSERTLLLLNGQRVADDQLQKVNALGKSSVQTIHVMRSKAEPKQGVTTVINVMTI